MNLIISHTVLMLNFTGVKTFFHLLEDLLTSSLELYNDIYLLYEIRLKCN